MTVRPSAEQLALRAEVALAARLVAPVWPLSTFIAVNPLGDLTEQPFDEAVATAGRWLGARGVPPPQVFADAFRAGRITGADLAAAAAEAGLPSGEALGWLDSADGADGADTAVPARNASERADPDLARQIDAAVARWCACFADEGVAAWALPGREDGLFACWRRAAGQDALLRARLRRHRSTALAAVPERADDALLWALETLGIPASGRVDELRGQLVALPGWVGYARWRQDWAPAGTTAPELSVLDVAAVRAVYDALLVTAPAPPAPAPVRPLDRRALVWLDAYERHYRDELLTALSAGGVPDAGEQQRPTTAQIVTCIDARSEGLRRHLEAQGPFETVGFAGFFGVPASVCPTDTTGASARVPVLLTPAATVVERPAPDDADAGRRSRRRLLRAAADEAWSSARKGPGSAFSLAESLGWPLGLVAALRTARPAAGPARPRRTVLDLDGPDGFSPEEQVLVAETALRLMGLTDGFAPLVVLCGHGSTTTANPHAAALDCGACGGNRGGPSARTAAALLNRPAVRAGLAERGIAVPPGTVFAAAEHDTALDTVTLLEPHLLPADCAGAVARVQEAFRRAGALLAAERLAQLPDAAGGGRSTASPAARAGDWAQVRPEWGLARNAAFVVGPRRLTAGLDLGCRTFLHSYDAAADPDGSGLEVVLTAPMVVAQWINAQYYFSSVDPDVFGAGDKTVHNPVGGVGVVAGAGGDLLVGLPWQSVAAGDRLHHEPMRLLTVVQAPRERLEAVIARNPVLQQLFGGGWVALAARDREGEPWALRGADGWRPWAPSAPGAPATGPAPRTHPRPDPTPLTLTAAAPVPSAPSPKELV